MPLGRIGLFAGDVGGGNEVVDAGLALAALGYEIDWRVSPENDPNGTIAKAGTVFDKHGIKYSRDLPSVADHFDLIVIGTSATATMLQVAATEHANVHGYPCVWVEDFPGTGNYRKVRETCQPDVICVVDYYAREAALNVRPNFKGEVLVCGKPSYSKNVGPLLRPWGKCLENRMAVRNALGFSDDTFVIVASLGVTTETLIPYLKVLTELGDVSGRPTVILSRIHPKCPEHVKLAALEVLAHSKTRIVESSKFSLQQVALAATAFVCTWGSTEQYCAALAKVPPLLSLGGEDQLEQRKELGYVDGTPPLIRGMAGVGFTSPEELKALVEKVASSKDGNIDIINGFPNFEPWVAKGAVDKIVTVCLKKLGV